MRIHKEFTTNTLRIEPSSRALLWYEHSDSKCSVQILEKISFSHHLTQLTKDHLTQLTKPPAQRISQRLPHKDYHTKITTQNEPQAELRPNKTAEELRPNNTAQHSLDQITQHKSLDQENQRLPKNVHE